MKNGKSIFIIKTIISIGLISYAIYMFLTDPESGLIKSTIILGLSAGGLLHISGNDEINDVLLTMAFGFGLGAVTWIPAFIVSLFTQYNDQQIYNFISEIVLVLCALKLFIRKDISYLKYDKYLADLDYPDTNEKTIIHRDRYGQRTGETVIKDDNAVHYNKYGQRTGESHLKK